MQGLKYKLEVVLEALETLFSDTTVSRETTLEALDEVEANVLCKIDALTGEIADARER